jgi:hypothetical protein
MARRFSAAWQRANHFDDARDSRFSSSVAIASRHPVTSLTPDIAVLEEIVLLLADGIRKRLRR